MRIALYWLTVIISAIVFAAPQAAHSTTHIINQVNLTFVPNTLTVVEGDTVRWIRSGGSHTVTNGTGAADPNAGILFDDPLDLANPTVEFVFTTAGSFPFFCRPHESFGMKGTITVEVATGVRTPIATTATLRQNYPNPFSNTTEIEYSVLAQARVKITIHDARGRLVATIEDNQRSVGSHRAAWNGRDTGGALAPTGIYFYRLEAGASVVTRKLIVLR